MAAISLYPVNIYSSAQAPYVSLLYSMFSTLLWLLFLRYMHARNFMLIVLQVFFLFLITFLADGLTQGSGTGLRQLIYTVNFAALTLIASSVLRAFGGSLPGFLLTLIIFLLLFSVPLTFIVYKINFGVPLSEDALYAIFQSNPFEAGVFLQDQLTALGIGILVLFLATIPYLLHLQSQRVLGKIHPVALPSLILLGLSLHLADSPETGVYGITTHAISGYASELYGFRRAQMRRTSGQQVLNAYKKENGETLVVLIGEALSKRHMGLYGYFRNTSPKLSVMTRAGELIVYDNAYSNHTHTQQSLLMSLTEANQYNGLDYHASPTAIQVFKSAGIKTYWITNQILYSSWDNHISVIAHTADELISLNPLVGERGDSVSNDEVVIEHIASIIEKQRENKAIFVHLMGSHGSYCARYPTLLEQYAGEVRLSDFGEFANSKNWRRRVNCYDNSVFYNDMVVSSILNALGNIDEPINLIYFADHADDLTVRAPHNSDEFTFRMTEIPLLIWASQKWRKRYPQSYTALLENRAALFSNDLIYDTLLGLFNIEVDAYQPVFDLSSPGYTLPPGQALTLHGRKRILDRENLNHLQSANISHLFSIEGSDRILPHRVNTVGKLHDIWFNGFRGFEVDVWFGLDGKEFFTVGHDNENMTGLSLENLLLSVDHTQIKKIWLDIKNFSQLNSEKLYTRLELLDKSMALKSKAIVEVSTLEADLGNFVESGWHVSYYLPTEKIRHVMKKGEDDRLALASRMAASVNRSKWAALSFDSKLYDFVASYLKPRLSGKLVFHTWDLSAQLFKTDSVDKVVLSDYFSDGNVETVLLPYHSDFHF